MMVQIYDDPGSDPVAAGPPKGPMEIERRVRDG